MNIANINNLNNVYNQKYSTTKPVQTNFSFSCAKINNLKDLPDTRSYALAFLGKKNYTQNERMFLNFRKAFSTKIHRAYKEANIAEWNFYTNLTAENLKEMEQKKDIYKKMFQDEQVLDRLKQFKSDGIKEPTLKRHLDDLIKSFEDNITYKEELKELENKESLISQKSNQYRGSIDGVQYADAELIHMLREEKDLTKRKSIYKALNGKGDLIANDLIELVKMRNNFARKKGYPNYFSYMLKEVYKVDEDQLCQLFNLLEIQTKDISEKLFAQRDQLLAKAYNIKLDELKPCHYGLKFDKKEGKAESYIKNKEDLIPLTFSLYEKMGWNLNDVPIKYDIYPRENKVQHNFCGDVDNPNDIRILANLREDIESLEILDHETGHATYRTGISNHIPYLDRKVVSPALNEAIALLMETLPYRETDFLKDKLGMPEQEIKNLYQKRKEEIVSFVPEYLCYINFEKEMYNNPDQDLPKLWFKLNEKYNNINPPDKFNNEWATIPHFLSHPAYLQNYIRAEIMAAQIYKAVTDKFGPMTTNPKTRDFLRAKMFRHGGALSEDDIMKKLTGSITKPNAFCEQIQEFIKDNLDSEKK